MQDCKRSMQKCKSSLGFQPLLNFVSAFLEFECLQMLFMSLETPYFFPPPNVCVQTESKASFRCRAIIHKRKDSMHAHNQKNVGKTGKMVHKTSTQSWGKQSPSDCDTSKKSKARVSNSFYTQPALILNEPDHLNSPLCQCKVA